MKTRETSKAWSISWICSGFWFCGAYLAAIIRTSFLWFQSPNLDEEEETVDALFLRESLCTVVPSFAARAHQEAAEERADDAAAVKLLAQRVESVGRRDEEDDLCARALCQWCL